MDINDDFQQILNYAHYWNWAPDWLVTQKIYDTYPDAYSVLTPFAYSYLEEIIRSTTFEYGNELLDENGKPKRRKVGKNLIKLAKEENTDNIKYIDLLEKIEKYFNESSIYDSGDNRNSVNHGYMHSRFWTRESFEKLIHDIAKISPFAKF